MKDLPDNELFSAYLDGELTAAEQAEMEQLLADNPAARQLLDEFRALSSTLQNMPQYTLGEDLSDRVLRIAERRMLTDSERLGRPAQKGKTWPAILRRFVNARALVWSALAVAIAVMFMLNQPAEENGGDLALAPEAAEHESKRDKTNAGAEFRAAAEKEEFSKRGAALTTDGKLEAVEGVDRRPIEKKRADVALAMATKTPAAELGDGHFVQQPVDKSAVAGTYTMKKPAKQVPEPTAPQVAEVEVLTRPLSVPGPGRAGKGGVRNRDENAMGLRVAKSSAGFSAQGAGPSQEGSPLLETPSDSPAVSNGTQTIEDAIWAFASRFEPVDSAYTIVCLDVRSSAVVNGAFDQTLGKNKILASVQELESNENGAGPADLEPSRREEKRDGDKAIEGLLADLSHQGELALLYVEATPEQIRGAVDDLTKQPEEFILRRQIQMASLNESASTLATTGQRLERYDDSATQRKDDVHKQIESLPSGHVWRVPIPRGFASARGREAGRVIELFEALPEPPASGGGAVGGGLPTQSAPAPAVPPPAGPAVELEVQQAEPVPPPAVDPFVPPNEPKSAPPSPPAVQPEDPATEPFPPKTPAADSPDAGTMRRTAPGSDAARQSPPARSGAPKDRPPGEAAQPVPVAEKPASPVSNPGQFGSHGGLSLAEKAKRSAPKARAFFVLRLVGPGIAERGAATKESAAEVAEEAQSADAAPSPAKSQAAPPTTDVNQ